MESVPLSSDKAICWVLASDDKGDLLTWEVGTKSGDQSQRKSMECHRGPQSQSVGERGEGHHHWDGSTCPRFENTYFLNKTAIVKQLK